MDSLEKLKTISTQLSHIDIQRKSLLETRRDLIVFLREHDGYPISAIASAANLNRSRIYQELDRS